jgi:hypothetical protein
MIQVWICILREHRVDRIWKPLQSVDDGDQDVVDAAVLQLAHHPHPELRPLGLLTQFSADGTFIAASSGNKNPNTATSIYQNYAPLTTVPGLAIGWIDDGQLLVNNYEQRNVQETGGLYTGCIIYSPTGFPLSTPPLPELTAIQTVAPNTIYAPNVNSIFALPTGARTWAGGISPQPILNVGAIAGGCVVFPVSAQVLAAPC